MLQFVITELGRLLVKQSQASCAITPHHPPISMQKFLWPPAGSNFTEGQT